VTILDTDPGLMPPCVASARFSPCRRYRYMLERTWDAALPPVCFLMLNPSTADAFTLDPTIRRCIGFARAWGHGGVRIVNLFAFRATSPADMRAETHPVSDPTDHDFNPMIGEGVNDNWIREMSDGVRLVAAWGCGGEHLGRAAQVMEVYGRRRVECLRTTADGHPGHPLYVPATTVPIPFAMRRFRCEP
jgi:hypothetical protein